jgi:methyltransferase (TIGR00027 family)
MGDDLPDATAANTALWRAAHLIVDDAPAVLDDYLAWELVQDPAILRSRGYPDGPDGAPEIVEGWLADPMMGPDFAPFRATIVGRARLVEDLVTDRAATGVVQYVILGAGLDTFALRSTDITARLRVFEIDEPTTQRWKRERLATLGKAVPPHVQFVPVNFESDVSWVSALTAAGFSSATPTVIASTGVTQYLSRSATLAMMDAAARVAADSTFVCTFMIPYEQVDADEQTLRRRSERRSAHVGHPWISSFSTKDFASMAQASGFSHVEIVTPAQLTRRYFAERSDGLRPSSSEHFLVASTNRHA